ncbi:MAG: PilT/PilU family type 4a pilus ATPase [Desulfobacter sp.]|nr:MAG: PilT/PilU family type 4a pilus ATPase [Desulfobacter sp.]
MNQTRFIRQFDTLLALCVERGASDMHLTSGRPPGYRIHGKLTANGEEILEAETITAMVQEIMSDSQREIFKAKSTVDLGYTTGAGTRFRLNIYMETGRPAMAVRYLNQDLPDMAAAGLPQVLKRLAYLPSGLVLITGATGSGKSTTLAMLLDEINQNRNCHILTVEDPVEFIHENKASLVHHREVGADVPCFASAVRAALREDPDVIMVGEMRDLETMKASITAAETGHLVFSTLHTGEAVGAVERFIGHFSGGEQEVARHRISMVLKAVIAQRLVPVIGGGGRVPALEMLRVNNGSANLIRTAKTRQLYSMMESGANQGMWTLDQDLARLVFEKKIARQSALDICANPMGFDRLVDAARGWKVADYAC